MDDLDRKLLSALSADARIALSNLARQLGVARTTVQARLEKLEGNGTIAGYSVRLGDAAQRNLIRASVLVQIEPRSLPLVLQRLNSMPQVQTVHTTSGRFDVILLLAAGNTAELDEVLDDIGGIKGVRSSESLIHLSTKIDRAV